MSIAILKVIIVFLCKIFNLICPRLFRWLTNIVGVFLIVPVSVRILQRLSDFSGILPPIPVQSDFPGSCPTLPSLKGENVGVIGLLPYQGQPPLSPPPFPQPWPSTRHSPLPRENHPFPRDSILTFNFILFPYASSRINNIEILI